MSGKQPTGVTHSKTPISASKTILTPISTPSDTPQRTPNKPSSGLDLADIMDNGKMDSAREDQKTEDVDLQSTEQTSASNISEVAAKDAADGGKKSKSKCRKSHKHKKSKKAGKKAAKADDSSSSDDESSDSSDDSSSSSDETSEDDKKKRRSKGKRKTAIKKKSKKHRKVRYDSSDDDLDSGSSDSSSSEEESRRRRRKRKARKARAEESEDTADSEIEDEVPEEVEAEADAGAGANEQLAALLSGLGALGRTGTRRTTGLSATQASQAAAISALNKKRLKKAEKQLKEKKKRPKKGTTVDFKRVNHVWDTTSHNWKIVENEEEEVDEWDEYAFIVRRKFDWDNHYTKTVVDIKSKLLKEALMEIMKDVQGETLEADEPSIDPNMLFLFLEDIRVYYKKTLKARLKKEKKRKGKKRVKGMLSHCRVLCKFLDEDYEETKKTLYPLLKAGSITFDLLWALFKPNTLAYTSTYGDHDNPRCFKVDRATKEQSFIKGEWYCIEGRYLEYDGKNYGLGDFEANVEAFKGSRKITSLNTYPLQYHKDPESIKKQLIERGKLFVATTGMNYRFHKGMAFQKKRKGVQKFNINGRVMVDPATFRRINPNYAISLIKPKEDEDEDESESEEDCGCGKSSDEDDGNPLQMGQEEKEIVPKTKFKVVFDKKKKPMVIEVPLDEDGKEIQRPEKLEAIASGTEKGRVFTEEELLIASPVVLGFAFSEKAWLEFSLSGIKEIEWNETAYESLVLPKSQKHVVKALVSSHKFHAAETIDDVVQGKGRGLVFVLHGPPGVGKTLTAEGVAEDLRCPLYAVSMGELGTDSNRLEQMLQQVMDIAHSWGAVLLLDEADVFLEKRQHQDVHRNALVSIFLRLLEYFQGILFLTTNRVETFDEAFQSRIHVALKYEELTAIAQKKVWKEFIEKVRVMQGIDVMPFSDTDLDYLARRRLNGRQIKNAVRTAQALALHEESPMSMEHIKRVLEVAESFEQDLKGGTGYLDAMRSYT